MTVMHYIQNKRLESGINAGNNVRVESALRHGADAEKPITTESGRKMLPLDAAILKGHVRIATALQSTGAKASSVTTANAILEARDKMRIEVVDVAPLGESHQVTITASVVNSAYDEALARVSVKPIWDSPAGYKLRELETRTRRRQ